MRRSDRQPVNFAAAGAGVGALVVVVVVVVVGGGTPTQTCDKLKPFTSPPVTSANDPANWRLVSEKPAGTFTKTLSVCPPFGMMSEPVAS